VRFSISLYKLNIKFWYQRYQQIYFVLFKKSIGIDGKFKVVIVEKEGNICALPSMNPKAATDSV